MFFATLAKCGAHEATRFFKNPSSADVLQCVTLNDRAFVVLPMRGAYPAGDTLNE